MGESDNVGQVVTVTMPDRLNPKPAVKQTAKGQQFADRYHANNEVRADRQAKTWIDWATNEHHTSVGDKLLYLASCYPGDG
jgi:hypothetical protein